jgi:hypothetical protein
MAEELRVIPRRDHELRPWLGELGGQLSAGLLERGLERRQVLGRRRGVDPGRPPHLDGGESGCCGSADAVVILAGLGEEEFDVGCELIHGGLQGRQGHELSWAACTGNLLTHVHALDDPAVLESIPVSP